MEQIWTGRVTQTVAKYGENAPTAAVCCNVCRTCVTTNLIGIATGAVLAAALGARRCARRFSAKPS